MTSGERDKKQIAAVIEQYRRGFAILDVDELGDIWDKEYENIIYIAQELAHPVHGWASVEKYYRGAVGLLKRFNTMILNDLSIDIFGDIACAFCTFHFEGEVIGKSEPRIADGRNTFILHRRKDVWKVIHYHESAPGLLEKH